MDDSCWTDELTTTTKWLWLFEFWNSLNFSSFFMLIFEIGKKFIERKEEKKIIIVVVVVVVEIKTQNRKIKEVYNK